jgi:hypothetical protein
MQVSMHVGLHSTLLVGKMGDYRGYHTTAEVGYGFHGLAKPVRSLSAIRPRKLPRISHHLLMNSSTPVLHYLASLALSKSRMAGEERLMEGKRKGST